MKTLPVYENLDTSFVNLSALIRHLRSRNFNGQARVHLRGYQAKITFSAGGQPSVEEHDQIAGRIAEGDEVLQRLLIRAREPGGTINVFEFIEELKKTETAMPHEQTTAADIPIAKPSSEKDALPVVSATAMPAAIGNGQPIKAALPANGNGIPAVKESAHPIPPKDFSQELPRKDFLNLVPENHAPLPLEFTNRVENRARQKQIAPEEWQQLLQLVGELLGAVDHVLKDARLNFAAMLDTARAEISDDYPFLNDSSGAFDYRAGTAEMSEQVNAKLFAASINELLRRILERLADNPDHSETYRDAVQKILALVHHHKPLYDKFFITPQLNRIVGV